MIPGMRGVNPKQLQRMLRAQGIDLEELDATEVIIKLKDGALVLKGPAVSKMTAQGQTTFQVVGKAKRVALADVEGGSGGAGAGAKSGKGSKGSAKAPASASYSEEDVALVMEQTGASDAEARAALQKSGGAPAEAIIALLG